MPHPDLTAQEQRSVEHGAWFGKLSAPLRADILARAQVRRLPDGGLVSVRGATADEWCGVAKGAVRIGSVSLTGKPITLTYAEPGTWFGDVALFDGLPRTHDASAHGETTLKRMVLGVGAGTLTAEKGDAEWVQDDDNAPKILRAIKPTKQNSLRICCESAVLRRWKFRLFNPPI